MRALPLSFLILLAPLPALAHPEDGDHGGLIAGFLHPVMGVDHLLAMLAVGLWAALAGGRALWAYPAAFLAAMAAGGLVGIGGPEVAVMEPAILASVVVLGAATALALRLPILVSVAMLAVFGLAHGYAHGVEGPAGLDTGYAAGFLLATAALHAAGLGLGLWLGRGTLLPAARALGAAVAAIGLWLALSPEAEALIAGPGGGHGHGMTLAEVAETDAARWIDLGAHVHGGFGSLIALGVRMGLEGAEAAGSPGRFQLEVSYQSSPEAPCPCVIDGLQVATRASLGQRNLTLDAAEPPADAFGVATFRNRTTGELWRATIPMSAWPVLRDANEGTTPQERWDIIMAADGLFTLERLETAP